MNPRRMNRLIDIPKPNGRQDQDTGEKIDSYLPHHRKLPAAVEGVSGGTTLRGRQVEATVNTVITIRHIEDIQSDYQVQIDAGTNTVRNLEIKAILDRDGRGEWLELHCSEIA